MTLFYTNYSLPLLSLPTKKVKANYLKKKKCLFKSVLFFASRGVNMYTRLSNSCPWNVTFLKEFEVYCKCDGIIYF